MRNATTGHLDGVITIDVMEADAVERERQRLQFGEPYRSLLGHLRHESGHFYWKVLVAEAGKQDAFRALFGDERKDYGAALARHHAEGPPPDWSANHVSAYASSHPWEDWAETWAHYLHMVSAVDTAEAEGMEPRASGLIFGAAWPFKSYDVYREETFDALIERWIPLSIALNNMSRGMGHDDFYPFVIPAPASRSSPSCTVRSASTWRRSRPSIRRGHANTRPRNDVTPRAAAPVDSVQAPPSPLPDRSRRRSPEVTRASRPARSALSQRRDCAPCRR